MSGRDDEPNSGVARVIILGAVAFALGHWVAFALLALRPIPLLASPPDPETFPAGEVFALRAERPASGWRAAIRAWESGESDQLQLSEAELNGWAEAELRKDSDPEEAPPGWLSGYMPSLQRVQFRLLDEQTIEVFAQFQWDLPTGAHELSYRAEGSWVDRFGEPRFKIGDGHLGQAPVGVVQPLNAVLFRIMRMGAGSKPGTQWLRDEWQAMDAIAVEDGNLVIRRKPLPE
jgi:hypothetical protein